ncbi:MAG: pyrroline-5-carboxylate reductase [Burkholderiaceae bacterium]
MKIAFIGGGNMANAMLGGLRSSGVALDAYVLEIDAAKGKALAETYGVRARTTVDQWLGQCEIVVVAVKPQQIKEAVASISPFAQNALVVSIAAGVRASTLARWLGHERIVRAMPNTPALIGAGITAAVALPAVDPEQRAEANRLLRAVGSVVWLEDEAQLDAVTAVSGSGPAYVFLFIEALEAAATQLGLSAAHARKLALGTFHGAARLAAESDASPAVLRDRVTSRGGTTAAALEKMNAAGIKQTIAAAVRAAAERAKEMGDELDRE